MLVAQKLPLSAKPYAGVVTLAVANDNDDIEPTSVDSRVLPPRPRPGSVTRAQPRAIERRAAPLAPPRPRTRAAEVVDESLVEEAAEEPEEADVTPSMILGADEVAAVVAEVEARAEAKATASPAPADRRAILEREALLLPLTLCFFVGFAALFVARWAAARLTAGWRDARSEWERAREAALARTR